MKTIYFVRHGQTEFNLEKRLQGWRDSPLSQEGIEQVKRVAKAVRQLDAVQGFASPLGRAQQTAQIIREQVSFDFEALDDLREVSFGDFEGNTLPELDVKFPGEWEKRQNEKWTYCPPGGEANCDAVQRGQSAIERFSKAAENGPVLVVAHFAINRIAFSLLAGVEPDETIQINVPHEVIYRAQDNGHGWQVSYWDARESGPTFQPGWITQIKPENQPIGG